MEQPDLQERIRGSLLGGAVGDALGAPVEFDSLAALRRRLAPDGVAQLQPAYGRLGAITHDTQMTLFTAEGIVLAAQVGSLSRSSELARHVH
ncbi:MAG: ADP-ribosylglycohydrolase family protein, partial [Myxococcota bacterium]